MIISTAAVGVRDSFSTFALPLSASFGLSAAQLGITYSIGILMGGFTQPILGYLFDRFNSRRVILINVAVAGLATVGLSIASDWWHVLFLYGVMYSAALGGASFGLLGPLTARWFLKRRALVLALLMAVPTVGSIFVTPTVSSLLITYRWREAYIVLGTVLLFLALPVGLKFLRNWPSEMGLRADGEPEWPAEAPIRGDAPVGEYGRLGVVSWWRAFRSPLIWVLLLVFAIGGFADPINSAPVSWLVLELTGSLGLIGIVNTVTVVASVIGAVAGGWLADRFPRKKVLAIALLAQGIALLVLVPVQTFAGLLLFAVLAGLSGTAGVLIALVLIADIYGLHALATLWGIAFLFNAIGRVTGPVSAGLAIEFTGGSVVLAIAASSLLFILASIMILAVDERKYSARHQAATGG